MVHMLIAGVGGMIGTILRYWLAGFTQRLIPGTFPVGTLAVNAIGCLAIGAIWSLVESRQWFGSPEIRIFISIGILGGFTTFSAFGYETFALLRDGSYVAALLNVTANVVIGMIAVTVGWVAAKAIAV
jgi:CrcB protein